MTQLSTLLGNSAGPCHTFKDGEREYKVSFLTQAVKAAFEKWIKAEALETLKDLRTILSPDEWKDTVQDLTSDFATKKYAFHGEVCQKAMLSPAGSLKLASLLFGIGDEEMIRLASQYPSEIQLVLEKVLKESAPNG